MTPAELIAIGISLLSLFISWRAYGRDRSDLQITVEFYLESYKGTAYRVLLVNRGRRPFHLKNVLVRLRSGKALFPKPIEPDVILHETESYEYWFSLNYYLADLRSPMDIQRVEVYDSSEKIYTFPSLALGSQIAFLKLKRRIAKDWTPENDWIKNKLKKEV